MKSHQFTKVGRNKGKGNEWRQKTTRKQSLRWQESALTINTQSKCKESGFTNKKTQMLKKKKTQLYAVYKKLTSALRIHKGSK